ncbi:hypothetical protein ANCCEY_13572 [Ancylostoma ceylanicum]|uniref:Uncharacterized protein n=1 Tax=Ancylostoma ceylanicum TaxID=53326 RepID=A0A0D6LBY8_9BILA|nr:hypothetical protein ANCCEY_13572 [Ancylostoma ceylanicum]
MFQRAVVGPSTANGPVFPPGVEPHRNPFAVQRPAEPPREDSEEDGINCSPCCDNENVSRTFRSIALGQVLSLCLCGTGISSQLLSNRGVNAPAGNHRVVGDLLCLGGAMLYAVANVSEEFLVKQHSRMEYLGMVGLFGSLISGVQLQITLPSQLNKRAIAGLPVTNSGSAYLNRDVRWSNRSSRLPNTRKKGRVHAE